MFLKRDFGGENIISTSDFMCLLELYLHVRLYTKRICDLILCREHGLGCLDKLVLVSRGCKSSVGMLHCIVDHVVFLDSCVCMFVSSCMA